MRKEIYLSNSSSETMESRWFIEDKRERKDS